MQNESNGGYVTEWNDLSGTILFVAATLQPCLVIVFYILNIIYKFVFVFEKKFGFQRPFNKISLNKSIVLLLKSS